MLLSDRDILAAQAEGHISLDPWTPEMVQPASIDVRLDRFFRLFNNHAYTYVDPAENQGELTEQFEVAPGEPWILHPGEFALGSTWEYVKLDPTIAARLEGKSSLGRLGILTHSTAGFIDPGSWASRPEKGQRCPRSCTWFPCSCGGRAGRLP